MFCWSSSERHRARRDAFGLPNFPSEMSTDSTLVSNTCRDRRAAADAAEVDLLRAAVTWADLHPVESIQDAALLSRYGDQPLTVAGPGAPLVAEFCVAEFAAAVGLPTESGRAGAVGSSVKPATRHGSRNGLIERNVTRTPKEVRRCGGWCFSLSWLSRWSLDR